MILELGEQVRCPADRGDCSYLGRIEHIAPTVYTNAQGVRYVWVTVRKDKWPGTAHVWPSHRLGVNLGNIHDLPEVGCLAHVVPPGGGLPQTRKVERITTMTLDDGSVVPAVALKYLGQHLYDGVRPVSEVVFTSGRRDASALG